MSRQSNIPVNFLSDANTLRSWMLACCVWGLFSEYSPAQAPCTQESTYQTLRTDYDRADSELNRIYEETLARLAQSEQALLRGYQREWLRQKGKASWPLGDLILRTKDRTDFLKRFALKQDGYPPRGFSLEEVGDEDATKPKQREFEVKNYVGSWTNHAGQRITRRQTWIVSTKDSAIFARLPVFRNELGEDETESCDACQHDVSPDQKWILRWQKDAFSSTAYLYKRAVGTTFVNATPKRFGDMAWDFLEARNSNNEKTAGVGRDVLRTWGIELKSWAADSSRVRVSLSGHEKHEWVVNSWTCDFLLKKGVFEEPKELMKQNQAAIIREEQ